MFRWERVNHDSAEERKTRLKISKEKNKKVSSAGNQSKPGTYLLLTNV